MRGAAASAKAGGAVARAFPDGAGPAGSVPALRLMAALHHLVLSGSAPELARFFPSVGGAEPPGAAWPAAEEAIEDHLAQVRRLVGRTVQTNEPGRSAVLYGALLWLAVRYRGPIRLLEIGASAGLNLHPDRYAYRVGGRWVGDPGSTVRLVEPWRGAPVPDPASAARRAEIDGREGCDLTPIDLTSAEGRLTVLSYIWPDEHARLARVRAAIEIALRHPVAITAAPASRWSADACEAPPPSPRGSR